jgi:hypothetical protein
VTEIPEHLLRRSKAAKGAKGGEAAPADSGAGEGASSTPAAPAAATPAPAAAPVPAEPAPEPPKPLPPYIAAHRKRRRIPVWALPVVVFLPVWALGFAGTMQEPVVEDMLFEDAAALYTSQGCAGCHGAGGGGGVGYAFSGGEIVATFPEPIDHLLFIVRGTAGTGAGEQYGDPDRPGGAHIAGNLGIMPAFPNLSVEELELLVLHERAVLGGEDASDPAYVEWEDRLREDLEAGTATPVDIDALLACANPEYTPGATGDGGEDCPGPHFD